MALLSAGVGWRGAFVCLAVASAVLALVYVLVVRETPPGETMTQRPKEGFRRTLGGSWLILRDRRLWPVFAMAFVGYASIFCIMGVWGGVYLQDRKSTRLNSSH